MEIDIGTVWLGRLVRCSFVRKYCRLVCVREKYCSVWKTLYIWTVPAGGGWPAPASPAEWADNLIEVGIISFPKKISKCWASESKYLIYGFRYIVYNFIYRYYNSYIHVVYTTSGPIDGPGRYPLLCFKQPLPPHATQFARSRLVRSDSVRLLHGLRIWQWSRRSDTKLSK